MEAACEWDRKMTSIPIPRSAARCGLVGVFILVCLGLVVSRKGGVLSSVNVRKSEGKATSNQYSLGGAVGTLWID